MNAKETSEITGGWLPFIAGFLVGAIVGGLVYDGLKWVYTTDVEEYGAWLLAHNSPGGAK